MRDQPNEYLSAAVGEVSSAFEFLCNACLKKGPDSVFDREFIKQAAGATDKEVRDWVPRFKKAWGHDFNIPRFRKDVAEARQSMAVPTDGRYMMTASGTMRPVVANAITMMNGLPIRFNQLRCCPELSATAPWGSTMGTWTETDDIKAAEWCQRQGLYVRTDVVREAVQAVAMMSAYHPVRQYFSGLQWDNQGRLYNWLTTYGGADDAELTREVGVRWLISGVARIMQPGCQADYTLVLEGLEGIKKSSALRALADPWFTDHVSDVGHGNAAAEQLQGHWIVEIKELAAFRRTEWTSVKAWLDRRYDKFRPAYGHRLAEFPRQNVFSASTNKRQWIDDDTGARRFWPIWMTRMDVDRLAKDRDQIWAEALHLYNAKERWYLDESLVSEAIKEQSKRRVADPWASRIKRWAGSPTARTAGASIESYSKEIYVEEVLEHCLLIPVGQWRQIEGNRVESILRGLGFTRVEEGVYGKE